MADIRKRKGKNGTTYQVRYPSSANASGYAFKSFKTRQEALAFRDSSTKSAASPSLLRDIRTVHQAIDRWLDICEKEGRDGRDPVTTYTLKSYRYRAEMMKEYDWNKPLQELQAPDIVEFRSWLLRRFSRDQARKTLSSFHSVAKEMALRGYIASNIAAGVSIRANSRYSERIVIPSVRDVHALLEAADRLANSKNDQIARSWERYRPILYLAADSGMRPQEYLVVARKNLSCDGVEVDRAIERGGYRISVTKTPAGRRFIELSPETLKLIVYYADAIAPANSFDLVFPTATGKWQSTDNWRKRGFYKACEEAGLMKKVEQDGEMVEKPKFKPYDLRHFYASMLSEQRSNLKRIQSLMGHEDIKTTLNTYGHLVDKAETAGERRVGMLATLKDGACGNSVAKDV
jgi:integrase